MNTDNDVDKHRLVRCDAKKPTEVGRVKLRETKELTLFGQWSPGTNWGFYGPTGTHKKTFNAFNDFSALVEVWLGNGRLLSREQYDGHPMAIRGIDEFVKVTVRMNDNDMGDNRDMPGDEMTASLV